MKRQYYDLYLLLEDLIEFDERLLLWRGRHIRMVERMIGQKHGTGGSSGAQYLEGTLDYRFFPELWEVRTYLGEGTTHERTLRTHPSARSATSFRFSELDVSRQPFDGCGAAAARSDARERIGKSGRRTVPRRGSAGCRASPRSPTASARSSARPPGSCFLGPNVSVLTSRDRDLHRLSRRAQRGRLRSAAVPVAHLRLARVGALRRAVARRPLR